MPSPGRPSKLANPEFAQKVAEALGEGLSRTQMCEKFDVRDPTTITRWKRDPRVKGILTKVINERVHEVTRKVDAKIAGILERDDLSVTELLAIRKEFLGGALRQQIEKVDEVTTQQAMQAAEDPEFQQKLADLFAGKS